MVRITNTMNACAQAQPCSRIEQEALELATALVVTPVPDPDEIDILVGGRERMEQGRVCRLVPGECSPRPAAFEIDVTQDLTKGKDSVVTFDIKSPQFRGISDRA